MILIDGKYKNTRYACYFVRTHH